MVHVHRQCVDITEIPSLRRDWAYSFRIPDFPETVSERISACSDLLSWHLLVDSPKWLT